MSASFTYFKDGYYTDVFFSHGEDINAVETFASNISAYTAAGLDRCSVAIQRSLSIAPKSLDAFAISLYAKVLMRCVEDGKIYAVLIHAPLASLFNEVEGKGYRMKVEKGEEIAQYYSAMAGKTFIFYAGTVVGPTDTA